MSWREFETKHWSAKDFGGAATASRKRAAAGVKKISLFHHKGINL